MKKNTRPQFVFFYLAAVVFLLALVACSGSQTTTPAVTSPPAQTAVSPTPSPAPPSGPSVRITFPQDSAALGTGNVTVAVAVTGFTLVNRMGQPNEPGQGHLIYYLDVEPPSVSGQPAFTEPGTFVESSSTSHVWRNVGSGEHRFSVQLVNNDHTPLDPPVTAAISVNARAQAGMPAVIITRPREGSIVNSGSITIEAEVSNFNLVDRIGQPNAPNEGHLIFYKDVEAPTIQGPQATTAPGTYAAATGTSWTWENVTPGAHTFSVQLVNNNNTSLNPPVSAKIAITVE